MRRLEKEREEKETGRNREVKSTGEGRGGEKKKGEQK